MAGEKEVRKFLKDNRRVAAGVLVVIAAGMLAAPLIIVGAAPGGWTNAGSLATRLTALYAFTFIFTDIFTGALAPYFYAIFKARREYLIHVITGSVGFLLALTHGLIVLTQRYYRGIGAEWLIGPVALSLLAMTVWVALDRDRLKGAWRFIHQINYVIFVAVFLKAVLIGVDFKLPGAASRALKILFSTYVALAVFALTVRLRRYQVQLAKRKRVHAAPDDTAVTETVD